MQLDLFPADVRLQCIDPAKNKRRFYVMKIQPNLFGEWELVREWGRIGAGRRVRRGVYTSAGLALDALLLLQQLKSRTGYSAALFNLKLLSGELVRFGERILIYLFLIATD